MRSDKALHYLNKKVSPEEAGTHVMIIAVGDYRHGKDRPGTTTIGGGLSQITSPPFSAREIAEWFKNSFHNPTKPLASVSMLISERVPKMGEANQRESPAATFSNVEKACRNWAKRLASNADNMAVFYFCGHGISQGANAAGLLEDFGADNELKAAIDLPRFVGVMMNSKANQQVFFIDACRTEADDLYKNQGAIGDSPLSLAHGVERTAKDGPAQQFVLYPTIKGYEAYGLKNKPSVFCSSLLDSLNFAAADLAGSTSWTTYTTTILTAISRLVPFRLPQDANNAIAPNVLNGVYFPFNEIRVPPVKVQSYVTISDRTLWEDVTIEVAPTRYDSAEHTEKGSATLPNRFCRFALEDGTWNVRATWKEDIASSIEVDRRVYPPASFVTLPVPSKEVK